MDKVYVVAALDTGDIYWEGSRLIDAITQQRYAGRDLFGVYTENQYFTRFGQDA